jgi:hypothetical protein
MADMLDMDLGAIIQQKQAAKKVRNEAAHVACDQRTSLTVGPRMTRAAATGC